jgi:hypothetical protein
MASCPRRCSATRVSSTSDVTGPSAHSTASVSSNNASARGGQRGVKPPTQPRQLPERACPILIVHTTTATLVLIFFRRQKHDQPSATLMINRGRPVGATIPQAKDQAKSKHYVA